MATDIQHGIAELLVDGVYYGGWKTVRVTRSIEQLAGTYELGVTDRWPGHPESAPLLPGQLCRLFLDEQPVITGFVDVASPDFDPERAELRIAGRDKTGDLVDCSAIYKSGQWHNVKLDRIAADLVRDYGIKVVVAAGADLGKPFASFAIQEGETVFETLDRAARMKAVLVTSNADGDLVFTHSGQRQVKAPLVEGKNIKAARAELSWRERHSSYIVKGHGRLGGDGDLAHSSATGKATDDAIKRHRPLIVLAESQSGNATLKQRAEWERNVRRGRGARGTITVQGWCDPEGRLWEPNTLVHVTSPKLWLKDAEMLIVGCVYSMDDRQGTLTELAIARPDAFELLAGVEQSKLFGKLRTREQRQRKERVDDWSML